MIRYVDPASNINIAGECGRRRSLKLALIFLIMTLLLAAVVYLAGAVNAAGVRVKDIARVASVRSNQLIGYGIVTGLNGTGDSSAVEFKDQAIANMLEHFRLTTDPDSFRTRNAAAVIVTADLPPFLKSGDRFDVTVSSLGDARSLEGGVLLRTPLLGLDGKVYAFAQGTLSIPRAGGDDRRRWGQRENLLTARIPGGAIVEREVPTSLLESDNTLVISLNSPDFTTASRLCEVIDGMLGGKWARAVDSGTVRVSVPDEYAEDPVAFIARIESLVIEPDMVNKIVIMEKSGTVVMGGGVRILSSVVSHKGLEVRVSGGNPYYAYGSNPYETPGYYGDYGTDGLSGDEGGSAGIVKVEATGDTVDDLVKALKAIGASPTDLIAILQALKASGAIQVELEII